MRARTGADEGKPAQLRAGEDEHEAGMVSRNGGR